MLNSVFGLVYGGIIAGTYLIAKLTGVKGGLDVACVSSFIAFILHIVIWPKLTTTAFRDWRNILRGSLFGITQIFLFLAQSNASTSTMLIASISGAIAGAWIGRIILKEHASKKELLAMLIAIVGTLMGTGWHIEANIYAITGGLIQGITGVTARSLMKSRVSRRGAVGSGFFILGLVTLFWILITDGATQLVEVNSLGVLGVTVAALCSQYAFFHLYRVYDTQKAVVFTLLRAPWGVALEAIFVSSGIPLLKAISSIVVFLAGFLAIPRRSK